ncbi:MAG: Omp28-related outer membrane protein [Bacteroidetes bacterium]|nr:Omp28-related outer membrane protein [Bacteroidota bacterium]
MKKNYFVLLVACLFLAKGIAQQVVEQQRSLVTKRTADWCPYCGTWGWNFFENAIDQNGNKAVYMAAHYSGALSTPAATAITENLGGGYQPRFFLDGTDQGVAAGNVNTKLPELQSKINTAFVQAPIVNCGFEPVYENGEIKVAAKVKFFQAAQGEFYLGIYLLEDHVTAYQASIGADAVHRHLFRSSFSEETYGQLISNENVDAGQEFSLNFALQTESPTSHEYEVIGIIWNKEGDKYVPMNVWSTTQIEIATVSSVQDPANKFELKIVPTVASQQTQINLETLENLSEAQLEVFDISGRRVAVLLDGQLSAGNSSFKLDRGMVGGAGLFMVQLKTSGFVKTEKVVFQ